MKRMERVGLALATIVIVLLLVAAPAAAQNKKPNVVLVLMDNLGWGEPGVYGGGILRGAPTPRIDQLAAEGMRLLNFNVEAQCTPSRAALMTGRYAIRTGNGSVPIDTPDYGLVQWEITMAKMLSDAGYATGAFGKWHLGHTEGRFPTAHQRPISSASSIARFTAPIPMWSLSCTATRPRLFRSASCRARP